MARSRPLHQPVLRRRGRRGLGRVGPASRPRARGARAASWPASSATTTRSWPPSPAATTTPPAGPGAIAEILALIQEAEPDLVVAGPAFTSGRYGLACARVAAAATAAGLTAVARHAPRQPRARRGRHGRRWWPAGEAARTWARRSTRCRPRPPRCSSRASRSPPTTAASAAAPPSAAVADGQRRRPGPSTWSWPAWAATGTPPRSPSPASTRSRRPRPSTTRRQSRSPSSPRAAWSPTPTPAAWSRPGPPSGCATRSRGSTELEPGEWRSVHGGFSTVCANADPHRILPLDVARQLEDEGAHRPALRGVLRHRRQRHVGGQRPPLRRRVGGRPAPLRGPGRHPHLHLRNGNALRGNACEGAGAGRDPHRPALQPDLDRPAGGRAADRADPGHPLPGRRPVAASERRSGPGAGAWSSRAWKR